MEEEEKRRGEKGRIRKVRRQDNTIQYKIGEDIENEEIFYVMLFPCCANYFPKNYFELFFNYLTDIDSFPSF